MSSMHEHDEAHIEQWHRAFDAATADRPGLAAFGPVWPLSYLAVASPERAVADAQRRRRLRVSSLAAMANPSELGLSVVTEDASERVSRPAVGPPVDPSAADPLGRTMTTGAAS
jgi:hypothetical protein